VTRPQLSLLPVSPMAEALTESLRTYSWTRSCFIVRAWAAPRAGRLYQALRSAHVVSPFTLSALRRRQRSSKACASGVPARNETETTSPGSDLVPARETSCA